ncbi:phosphoribosylanthranilate isomerase [Alkalibaculum sp. M08DMB]|uniref:N-(5'-phosphoribosyl)anthranilate isomerase n=1 Tax=Alkalibaculum sporogenes TaxID=2655001 RepID=A0A6A7KBH3_9FIRM|nr:phosphoribosylanthranilate isomerase [Alkalibaculum sporogenes]MPW26712.1 phosphoribosylanthranilate isomerase [Alkalibaculum sporogenes]
MTGIKICGLTREEDIYFINSTRPEYIGFVFAKSKRQVDPHKCKRLISLLDSDIKVVGVFVNSCPKEINDIVDYCKIDIVQLHGNEKQEMCNDINSKVWKAFRVKDKYSLDKLKEYKVDGYLLDAYDVDQFGGTGSSFNWSLVKDARLDKEIILAGGITPDNVQNAIRETNAQIIDISSGVETNGIKDFDKIKTLIERVREIG